MRRLAIIFSANSADITDNILRNEGGLGAEPLGERVATNEVGAQGETSPFPSFNFPFSIFNFFAIIFRNDRKYFRHNSRIY